MAAPVQDPQPGGIPLGHGSWTFAEWLALPSGKANVELVDGLLVMSPAEAYRNRRLQRRIVRQLEDAAPAELEVMPDCNVALGGDRALIPDFAVIDEPGFDGVVLAARHHVLVGEITSPSTRVFDRTTKRALYAEAGIPFLMLVDPDDPPSAVLFELHDGEYAETARSEGGIIAITHPFPVVLDLGRAR